MAKSDTVYPLAAVRALALHAQALTTPAGAEPPPTPDAICEVVERLGCVQLDTLQVVRRSHYLVPWSRLGRYDPANLDRLIYGALASPEGENPRRLFEGWLHAACIIPLSEYRYRLPYMRRLRERPARRTQRWLSRPGSAELLAAAMERIRRQGPLRAADFEYTGPKRGSWWDWKPAKTALEHLFACGDLMVADRVNNFQRAYDLRERVLPDWVDRTEPTWDDMARHVLEHAVRSFGLCRPGQAADYIHSIKRTPARPFVEELLAEGVFLAVQADLSDGKRRRLIVHRDNLSLLKRAADGALTAERTTFLSPFDNLFWARGRDEQLWGFRSVLEAYKPRRDRKWGYFCLPILHRDRFVGRFDPKMERQAGTLRLKSLYLEPGIDPDGELVSGVAAAMRDFMAFHDARDLVVEGSQPVAFREKLLAAL